MKPGPFWLNREDAAAKLARGGVLLLPTDTIVGLHCRADRAQAVERIVSLKGRAGDQPLLLLASGLDQVGLVADASVAAQAEYCRRCWPGPFTLILGARADIPVHLATQSGTIAVRIPAWPGLQELIEAVGFPLVSTSANRTGNPPCADLQAAADLFGEDVDGAWLEDDQDSRELKTVQPSALIDVAVWPPRILRPGPLPAPRWDVAGGS